MAVEGTATVNICANNLMRTINAVISSDLRDNLLVGIFANFTSSQQIFPTKLCDLWQSDP